MADEKHAEIHQLGGRIRHQNQRAVDPAPHRSRRDEIWVNGPVERRRPRGQGLREAALRP